MRPISLTLKGFTAYRDQQELDFSELDLFALWGPMGSGKSSLLDAITYVLYGKVERVGKEAKQLISQGQPSMAVSLEFHAGHERYRVTRRTQRSGGTTARLDVLDGGEWRSNGEGSDSVKGVNRMITEIIGLDYLAFTRSVLLPQGKFAEFLVGEARDRRGILTELLGLELFDKMSRRSNEIATQARNNAEVTANTLEKAFAGVTAEALAETRATAKEAKQWAAQVATLETEIGKLARRAETIERSVATIDASTSAIEDAVSELRRFELTLGRHVEALISARDDVETAKTTVEKAKDALDGAEADLAKARREWGNLEQLAALGAKTEELRAALSEVTTAVAAHTQASEAAKRAEDDVEILKATLKAAHTELKSQTKAVEAARKVMEEAHRKDLVGALVSGLETGAPCPVCDRPLKSIPQVAASAHEKAAAAVAQAERAKEAADKTFSKADKALAVGEGSALSARKDEQRCHGEGEKWAKKFAHLEKAVADGFGGELPDDPGAVVASRLSELRGLAAERDGALEDLELAKVALQDQIRAVDGAHREVEQVRIAMAHSGTERLVEQVRVAAPLVSAVAVLPSPLPDDPEPLAQAASAAAEALTQLESALRDESDRMQRERAELTAEGRSLVPDSSDAQQANLDDLLAMVSDAARTADKEAVKLETTAAKLASDLDTKKSLGAEVDAARAEHNLYRALHLELRSDRIVDYLQAEALRALASAGSERLFELSGNRYRLAYEADEFFVIDGWNGDERRSVHTLSGGETFLASLALALALSEQVQLLAVTEKRRLESLFLDEGFGSLDAEALNDVVAAIEQLGGDDRMVGIITHVTEVADRLPVRIQVEKSPRGSRLVPSIRSGV